ncbi:MAG TPA: SDR family oxidoreductase, partial [Solirubrobacterales bacterium]|nr:SDR family oxidoreductase [Solirubrobacterales bacterium]
LSADHGVVAETIACDLAKSDERDRLAGELRERRRTVELLVNNAGFGHQADFATSPRERMVGMVRLNVEAVVDLTSRFVGGMVERGRGAVINVASTGAFQPLPGSAVYGATKSFVLSFSEALRTELRGTGVTVTAVCPGPVRTEFTEAAGIPGVEDRTPGAFWMSAEDVARHAVDGAERDRRVVVPGAINRAAALAGQHSPRAVALPLIGRFWRHL